jgi:hypothetical protein
MIRSVKTMAFLLLALAGSQAVADDGGLRRYVLPNLDTLELALPAGWQDETDVPPGGTPLTIRLYPAAGSPFEVFVTPESPEPTAGDVRDTEALRAAVGDAAARIRPQAVEESIEIRRLQGGSGIGFYFAATDRAPQPEEFRCMNQGALQAGELTLWFTILTNDGQEAVVADALAMLQAAVHRRTGLDQR